MAIALSHSLEQPILLVNWSLRSLNRNLFPVRMTETMKQLHFNEFVSHSEAPINCWNPTNPQIKRAWTQRPWDLTTSTTADEFWAMSMADPLTASLQDEKLFEKLVQNAAARLATFQEDLTGRSEWKIWTIARKSRKTVSRQSWNGHSFSLDNQIYHLDPNPNKPHIYIYIYVYIYIYGGFLKWRYP